MDYTGNIDVQPVLLANYRESANEKAEQMFSMPYRIVDYDTYASSVEDVYTGMRRPFMDIFREGQLVSVLGNMRIDATMESLLAHLRSLGSLARPTDLRSAAVVPDPLLTLAKTHRGGFDDAPHDPAARITKMKDGYRLGPKSRSGPRWGDREGVRLLLSSRSRSRASHRVWRTPGTARCASRA